jgi:hypothetical protein
MLAFVDLLVLGVLGCIIAAFVVLVCAVAAIRELLTPGAGPTASKATPSPVHTTTSVDVAASSRASAIPADAEPAARSAGPAPATRRRTPRPAARPVSVQHASARKTRLDTRHHVRPRPHRELPAGAEAALQSILEIVPGPLNTLAMEKDPTAEVRITPIDEIDPTGEVVLTQNGRHLLAR